MSGCNSGSTHSATWWRRSTVYQGSSALVPTSDSSSSEGDEQLVRPVQYSLALSRQDTKDWQEEDGFQSLALFAVQKSFGDITEAEVLSNQYCAAAWSVEEATPGIQKKLLHLPALWWVSFPSALISFNRLKHRTQASSKTLQVWSSVRTGGPRKTKLVAGLGGHYPDTWRERKGVGRSEGHCPRLQTFSSEPPYRQEDKMAGELHWPSSWAAEGHNCKAYTD